MTESMPEQEEINTPEPAKNPESPSDVVRAHTHTDVDVDVKDTPRVIIDLNQTSTSPQVDLNERSSRPLKQDDILLPPMDIGLVVESRQSVTKTLHRRQDAYLEALKKFFPHVQRACMLSGVTRPELKKWFETVPEFRAEVQAITNEMMDTLEAYGFEKAMQEKGFGYWVTLLKAYRPEKFAPRATLPSDIRNEFDSEIDRARRVRLAEIVAIDGEVIEATTGAPPPHIEIRRKDEISPVDTVDEITPPVPTKGTVIAQPDYPAYAGDIGLIVESMEGPNRTFDPTNVPELARPKNPTNPDFHPGPHPPSPSHKKSQKKRPITVDKTKHKK